MIVHVSSTQTFALTHAHTSQTKRTTTQQHQQQQKQKQKPILHASISSHSPLSRSAPKRSSARARSVIASAHPKKIAGSELIYLNGRAREGGAGAVLACAPGECEHRVTRSGYRADAFPTNCDECVRIVARVCVRSVRGNSVRFGP